MSYDFSFPRQTRKNQDTPTRNTDGRRYYTDCQDLAVLVFVLKRQKYIEASKTCRGGGGSTFAEVEKVENQDKKPRHDVFSIGSYIYGRLYCELMCLGFLAE